MNLPLQDTSDITKVLTGLTYRQSDEKKSLIKGDS